MPTQDVKNLARKDILRKGSNVRNTLAGRAMKIMNRPISRAGMIADGNWEGRAIRPRTRNMSNLTSQVSPSKNFRMSRL